MRHSTTKSDDGQSSSLLPLARAIDGAAASYRSNLQEPCASDPSPAEELMRRRVELASCSPQNNLDALVMLASAEAIASLLVVNDSDDLGPDAVRLGATELALAIGNVRAFLERETGVTAKALGISGEGTAWQ